MPAMSSKHERQFAVLVPRYEEQGYGEEALLARRRWVEEQTETTLPHVAGLPIAGEVMRGNIENPIGSAQVPLGVAGPLAIHGEHAQGQFYVPLATNEGALVRSYERGMMAMTRCGGASARVLRDENLVSPMFSFDHVGQAVDFARRLPQFFGELERVAGATTRHGRLLSVDPVLLGRDVAVHFHFFTADAHGMNMIVKATEAACSWLASQVPNRGYLIFSGAESEKRQSGRLLAGGKGKTVTAGVLIPARWTKAYLHATPEEMVRLWRQTMVGHVAAGTLGYNGHFANGLTALFIACGQDVANVVNSAIGLTSFEVTAEGDLYASVTLPALTVATVGGGTGFGTAQECLRLLGCAGSGGALKLAEITAAMLLAGELSMGGAIASAEFVAGHERYGRNRPEARHTLDDPLAQTSPEEPPP